MDVKDNRNPERLGNMLASLKTVHPELSAAKRADMIEEIYSIYNATTYQSSNGK